MSNIQKMMALKELLDASGLTGKGYTVEMYTLTQLLRAAAEQTKALRQRIAELEEAAKWEPAEEWAGFVTSDPEGNRLRVMREIKQHDRPIESQGLTD